MREETNTWFARVCSGLNSPHATAVDGHNNLIHTMAMDLSAARSEPVTLPIDIEEFYS